MNRFALFIIVAFMLITSCESSTGYTTPEQDRIINLLTSNFWVAEDIDEVNDVIVRDTWKFEKNGKGFNRIERIENGIAIFDKTFYFQWAFTTESMAVIYILRQEYGDSYWLIDELSVDILKVSMSIKDPVLNPDIDRTIGIFTHSRQND